MIDLNKLSTLPPAGHPSKAKMDKAVDEMKSRLFELQNILYAQHKYSVLVILQGMDASGKDGLVNHAFSGINPAGVRVYSWKKPTETEADHDFLWRIHQAVPAKGMIHIFNRSHYEDILVPTVFGTLDPEVVEKRYKMINQFEHLLTESGTLILKFYLHVSEKEQLERLKERLTIPEKKWKYDGRDILTIKNRQEFLETYAKIFKRCSRFAPWHIIPTDKNRYKEYLTLKIMLEAMEKLPLSYPAKLPKDAAKAPAKLARLADAEAKK